MAIDRTTGEYHAFRRWEVVEDPEEGAALENPDAQIALSEARARDAALVRKVGARVDDLVEEVVHLLSALRAKQGLGDKASPFALAADTSAKVPK